jgi:hypothetical protein
MNKPHIFVFIAILFFSSVSCSIESRPQGLTNETTEIQNRSVPTTSDTVPVQSQSKQMNPDDLAVIKNYAENYQPKPEKDTVIPSTPLPNGKELQAIDALANTQSREYEKYIVLIFLRLHRYHIEHFKQSYDLGSNPLAKEFYRLTQVGYNSEGEPILSYEAAYWIKNNPELLKYSLIKDEMKRIEIAGKKIQKELDETTKEQDKKAAK